MKLLRELKHYLAKHYLMMTLFLLAIAGLIYVYHVSSVDRHAVYETDRIGEETQGTDYTITTYSEHGDLIASVRARGLCLDVTPEGNLSGGRRAHYSTVGIKVGGHKLRVSGALIIAYPTHKKDAVRNYLTKHDFEYPKKKPLGDVLTGEQNEFMQKYGKLLIIKTYSGIPVSGFFGSNIRTYYTNVDESQVFNVDGSIIFVTRGWFSIDDTYLFTQKK